ncbi:MAG: hypothetical protein AELANPGJ_03594 [Anaerolineae bacterium]|nr:hypothetical protein [Anaerolineae bacterium]
MVDKPVPRVDQIDEITMVLANGQIAAGYRVYYTFDNKSGYFVDLPKSNYTPELAKEKILEECDKLWKSKNLF